MMASACLICLKPTRGDDYHPECCKTLFGTKAPPILNLNLAQLNAAAVAMVGKMSLSGVQEKVSLQLSEDRTTLRVAQSGGRYILKPQPTAFPALPQNEHLTMCLASLAKISTPPFGLIRLNDGALVYVVKRFDRIDDGTKLAVEDFCQLSETPLRDKYKGSAELCVRLLRKYASEPLIECRKLFQVLVFGWWTANGDMHLKNISIITNLDGTRTLTPAYDLVCTKVAIPTDDSMALVMQGRNKNLTRKNWLDFASYSEIRGAAERLLADQVGALDQAIELVRRSFLPKEMREAYENVLRERTETLVA